VEIYFNPYPGVTKTEIEGIQCIVKVADAFSRLQTNLRGIPLPGVVPDDDVDVQLSNFVVVRDVKTEWKFSDLIWKTSSSERDKLRLLLNAFSRGRKIEAENLYGLDDWILTNVGASAPILAFAAQNGAIALTIPTDLVWSIDVFSFEEREEILHNLWGQDDISAITNFCKDSLKNTIERFKAHFNADFCDGALNSAPKYDMWERLGHFKAMKKAKEHAYNVDGDLIKNKGMPKTEKYGSLLELRFNGLEHRIFFVHRQGLNPEILIGGFYQKNESISQSEAIQNAKKRIDEYVD